MGSDASAAWSALWSVVNRGLAGPSKLACERVLIGNGLPVIPKTLLDKIQRLEFVDLAELLPSNSWHDQITEAHTTKFTLFLGYELVKPKRKQLESIIDWVKAFSVYTAAVVQKHPSMVTELLAYQLTIIKASQQYDGLQWRAYDTQFRVAAAATGNRSWSKLYVDLYTRFFTGHAKTVICCSVCDSSSHSSASCPSATGRKREFGKLASPALSGASGPKRRRNWSSDVCALYNTGSCFFQKCKYRHICGDCGGHILRRFARSPRSHPPVSEVATV